MKNTDQSNTSSTSAAAPVLPEQNITSNAGGAPLTRTQRIGRASIVTYRTNPPEEAPTNALVHVVTQEPSNGALPASQSTTTWVDRVRNSTNVNIVTPRDR